MKPFVWQDVVLANRLVNEEALGFVVGLGECDDEGMASVRQACQEELEADGLPRENVSHREYSIGRGASGAQILVIVTGIGFSVASIFAAIKQIDEGFPVLLKWARFVRRVAAKVGAHNYTLEMAKLTCIEDLIARYGTQALPDLKLLRASSFATPVGDGSWRVIDPAYIIIPDRERGRTHLYVVSRECVIIHYAELPVLEEATGLSWLRGPLEPLPSPIPGDYEDINPIRPMFMDESDVPLAGDARLHGLARTTGHRVSETANEDPRPRADRDADGNPQDLRDTERAIEIHSKVFFEPEKTMIELSNHVALEEVTQTLKDHPELAVRIEGHADGEGEEARNLSLSLGRAESVRAYLILQGIDHSRLTSVGYGAARPVDTNCTAAGKAANRRVEFTVIGLIG